jgi:hypothetical protein
MRVRIGGDPLAEQTTIGGGQLVGPTLTREPKLGARSQLGELSLDPPTEFE